ncbi:hypothetical protein D0859_16421 [Hortaea werneckii]|uniref:Uncharacterized protein n=1 Tax=Hortaea werneckii TaxID=91943 RepID=A0A3M7I1X9_HORWE|nr:hypothetical protein D0859_16421 [Hortaea werneckii]
MALGAEEVVAIAICGALAAIGLGWALTHRFYMNKGREEAAQNVGSGYSQAQYMREVRLRHQEDLAASQYGRGHFPMATPSAMESHGTLHYADSPKVRRNALRASSPTRPVKLTFAGIRISYD